MTRRVPEFPDGNLLQFQPLYTLFGDGSLITRFMPPLAESIDSVSPSSAASATPGITTVVVRRKVSKEYVQQLWERIQAKKANAAAAPSNALNQDELQ